MDRCLERELLDELDSEHASASHCRRDLRRLNAWMGNASIIASALQRACAPPGPRSVVELGSGDGTLLLNIAGKLKWRGVQAILVDKQSVVREATLQAFRELEWCVECVEADVIDWLRAGFHSRFSVVLCNLFLHHFTEAQLAEIFSLASQQAELFVATEPRRSGMALLFSRMVGLIGCNAITRHDAPASVRAGFRGRELSYLWPRQMHWITAERPRGLFSHFFVAQFKR